MTSDGTALAVYAATAGATVAASPLIGLAGTLWGLTLGAMMTLAITPTTTRRRFMPIALAIAIGAIIATGPLLARTFG